MTLHVESSGSGPDLVLLHGWAMHGGIFAPLTPLLAAHFRVHVVDLPGHGRSAGCTDSIETRACAAAIAARVPRALWVGWSYGGLVSLQAALTQEPSVRGIVEIAASPRFVSAPDWAHGVPAEVFVQFAAGLADDYRETIERFLALETLGSDRAQQELRELRAHVFDRGEPALAVLEQGLDLLRTTDLRTLLPALAVPSLWIAGRRDRLVPAAALRWAAAHSPNARFLQVASGHAPFLGHAAEVAEAIVAFAAGIDA